MLPEVSPSRFLFTVPDKYMRPPPNICLSWPKIIRLVIAKIFFYVSVEASKQKRSFNRSRVIIIFVILCKKKMEAIVKHIHFSRCRCGITVIYLHSRQKKELYRWIVTLDSFLTSLSFILKQVFELVLFSCFYGR